MQQRHADRKLYFNEQSYTTEKYVIPFIEKHKQITANSHILEIGCGEGGNLKPLLDRGCKVTGIDIDAPKIEAGKKLYADHPHQANLSLICEDIFKVKTLQHQIDVIILRDVIEHLPHQAEFITVMRQFLKEDGVVFVAFPPWQNPFGGHQQICNSKLLSHFPFLHLLPKSLYKWCLTTAGENPQALMEIKETGISLERFLRIVKKGDYQVAEEVLYFINPNYEVKFGLKPRKIFECANIPYLRNFWTTCGYYLLKI